MNCENQLCIYFKNKKCILEEIHINKLSMCSECIIVNLDDYTLEKERENY